MRVYRNILAISILAILSYINPLQFLDEHFYANDFVERLVKISFV
jgi:hypothetical protein